MKSEKNEPKNKQLKKPPKNLPSIISIPFVCLTFKLTQKKKSQSVWRTATKTTSNAVAIRTKQIGRY